MNIRSLQGRGETQKDEERRFSKKGYSLKKRAYPSTVLEASREEKRLMESLRSRRASKMTFQESTRLTSRLRARVLGASKFLDS